MTDTVDPKLKGEYAVAVLTQRTFMAQRIQRILRFSTRCIRALHVASENLVDQLDTALGTHVRAENAELSLVVKQLRQTIEEEEEVPESGYVLSNEDGIPPSLPAFSLAPATNAADNAVDNEVNIGMRMGYIGTDALDALASALREAALGEKSSPDGMQYITHEGFIGAVLDCVE